MALSHVYYAYKTIFHRSHAVKLIGFQRFPCRDTVVLFGHVFRNGKPELAIGLGGKTEK